MDTVGIIFVFKGCDYQSSISINPKTVEWGVTPFSDSKINLQSISGIIDLG